MTINRTNTGPDIDVISAQPHIIDQEVADFSSADIDFKGNAYIYPNVDGNVVLEDPAGTTATFALVTGIIAGPFRGSVASGSDAVSGVVLK